MIWGMTLHPGEEWTRKIYHQEYLTIASLECRPDKTNGEANPNACLMIKTDETEHVLCTLEKGLTPQQKLDLILQQRETVTFIVHGTGTVYLTGYTLETSPACGVSVSQTQTQPSLLVLPPAMSSLSHPETPSGHVDAFGHQALSSSHTGLMYEGQTMRALPQQNCNSMQIVTAGTPCDSNAPSSDKQGMCIVTEIGISNASTRISSRAPRHQTGNVLEHQHLDKENYGMGASSDSFPVPMDSNETGSSHPSNYHIGGNPSSGAYPPWRAPSITAGALEEVEPTVEVNAMMETKGGYSSCEAPSVQSNVALGEAEPETNNAIMATKVRGKRKKRKAKAKPKTLECQFCLKLFSERTHLIIHERVHTGHKPFGCTFCVKSFATKGNLQVHERVHTGARPFTCQFCERSFSQVGSLRGHERIHTGERPFGCQLCPRTFTIRSNLRMHAKIHALKPHQCPRCNRAFADEGALRHHQTSKHGGIPIGEEVSETKVLGNVVTAEETVT